VREIDTRNQRIRIRREESGSEYTEAYDYLMIATGAQPIRPDVPGIDAGAIFGVSGLQSAIDIQSELDMTDAKQVVVVGGGYIGLEMAEAMALRGMEVALVEKSPEVMNTLDSDMAAMVSQALEEGGVALYLSEKVKGFERGKGRVTAVETDQRRLAADMVILGLGVQPNTALADRAGIPLGIYDSIKVNDRMQTGTPAIWSAGDCVQSYHLVSRKPFYIALGTGRTSRAVWPESTSAAATQCFPASWERRS
jgi:NADPH-dependent 2,4-dienoyl-CoA reductase/sulfur reductase-like enzyme